MSPRFIVCFLIAACAVHVGCGHRAQTRTASEYTGRLANIEKWISESDSFAKFEEEMVLTQAPTQYSTSIKKLSLPQGADLAAMCSIKRKNDHVVVMKGAARTKSGEVVGFLITINESIRSK